MDKLLKKLVLASVMTLFAMMLMAGMAAAATTYTVQNGDSLFLIAQRYGVTVSQIRQANGLSGDSIYVGQNLTISGGTSTSSGSGSKYIVKSGDTLSKIASNYGTTVDAIRKANNLWKDFLYPGQALTIPGQSSRTAQVVSRSFSRSELDLLARAVYAEARGEVYEGQVAVAAVILNRVKNSNFPNTISGVIYEPWAFSCVNDGQINLAADATAYKAVQDAINGWDPTSGALYYWNPVTATSKWIWSRTITTQIGNHVFGI